jgi:HNH endonuclease
MATPCILWPGRVDEDGYGRGYRGRLAHRLEYANARGPIPEGLTLDHLCRNRACVNPSHLEAVSLAENLRRRIASAPAPPRFCKSGHEFTPRNTYRRPPSAHGGARQCRACNLAAVRRYQERPA